MALAMIEVVDAFNQRVGQHWQIRIGMHTGALVAGIIGSKKFAYDLWGDTVNLASRMEAHAPANGILVTAATYERLRGAYTFKPGRVIRVKGKGEVLTYLLLCKSPSSSA